MKICYLSESPLHLGKIMDYFASHGHEVSYITFRGNDWKGVENYHLWEPIPRCYITYFLNLSHVKKLIKKINPDIIHAYYLTNFGFLGACSGFKPFVVSAVGTDTLILPFKTETKNVIITALINRIVRYVLHKADAVISMASHVTEKLVHLGASNSKIHQFAEGVDLEKFCLKDKNNNVLI